MVRDSHRAVLALQALIPCTNDITLCLEFTYVHCLDNWLRDTLIRSQQPASANHLGETDPTRRLRCVKALELDSKLIAYSSDGVVQLLVRWLCMFPELTKVFITRPCLPLVFGREEFEGFAKEVQRGSASMKVISVESDDASVWTWSKRHLTSETLAIILEYALAPARDLERRDQRYKWNEAHTPLVSRTDAYRQIRCFSLVSSYWRKVVQSAPRLWTSLVINVQLSDHVPRRAALLQLYLERLKRLRISLELNLLPRRYSWMLDSYPVMSALDERLEQFIALVNSNAERFRVFHLSMPNSPPLLLHKFPLCRYRNVESFCFGRAWEPRSNPPYRMGDLDLTNNHSLRRLILRNVETIGPLPIIAQTITAIDLCAVSLPHCIHLELTCPNLVEYWCRFMPYAPGIGDIPMGPEIVMHHLQDVRAIPFFEAVSYQPGKVSWHAISIRRDFRDEMDSARHFEIEPADEDTHSDRLSWSFLLVDCVTARWNTPLRQWPAGLRISIQDVPDGLDLVINHHCNIDLMYYLRNPQIKIGDDLDKDCMFTESNRNEYT
ncbi:hypothetical protein NP233_g11247 [Leucocoprinus birnbaumii]|uniref:F-box domain-containing protein n=1 Tax=Leucocoprinus birnbaumii TaxID=56174 RepID=A0AAD5YKL2_9AGAR|nr:hypothetical protein NP233_g11247 [Leucocoprinus birnbaumii]